MADTVYAATDVMDLSLSEIRFMESLLPEERLSKAARYRREQDRRSCIMAYFLLLYGLSEEHGIYRIPETTHTSYGKPYFRNIGLCFNLSHCDSAVCCGISCSSIGVDAEDTVKGCRSLLNGVLSDGERAELSASMTPEDGFTRLWTLKESYLKYLGTGICGGLKQADFSGIHSDSFERYGCSFCCKHYKGWELSVCTENSSPAVNIHNAEYYIRKMQLLKAV